MRRLAPILVLGLAVACGSVETITRKRPAAMPPDANRMRSDHAPTPFSAEAIRRACPPGRLSVYRVEREGRPPVLRTFAFHGGDTTSGALEITDRTESGAVIGKPRRTERRWTKFQAQASYPRSSTIITQDDADTPAGDFDCWLYTVREKQDGRVTVRREWYAWSLPGPPVRTIEQVDGKTVLTTTLVEVMLPRR